MTPSFDPDALRGALQPLAESASGPTLPPDLLAAYRRHYGLLVPEAVEHRLGRIDVAGVAVAVQVLRPPMPRGTLVAVHGLFDHAGLWRYQIRWALARNLAVCAPDLPGHGLSGGRRAHVDDFAHYVRALEVVLAAVADDLPRPWIGLGHSTGGAVLMQAAHEHARPVAEFDDLILLAPLVRSAGHRLGRLLLPALSLLRRELPRGDYANTRDPEFNALRRADPLQPPTLSVGWVRAMQRWGDAFTALPASAGSPCVIQGTDDRTLAWRENLDALRRLYTDPHIALIEGAGHNLMNEAAPFRAQVEAVLDARLDALLGEGATRAS